MHPKKSVCVCVRARVSLLRSPKKYMNIILTNYLTNIIPSNSSGEQNHDSKMRNDASLEKHL